VEVLDLNLSKDEPYDFDPRKMYVLSAWGLVEDKAENEDTDSEDSTKLFETGLDFILEVQIVASQ